MLTGQAQAALRGLPIPSDKTTSRKTCLPPHSRVIASFDCSFRAARRPACPPRAALRRHPFVSCTPGRPAKDLPSDPAPVFDPFLGHRSLDNAIYTIHQCCACIFLAGRALPVKLNTCSSPFLLDAEQAAATKLHPRPMNAAKNSCVSFLHFVLILM